MSKTIEEAARDYGDEDGFERECIKVNTIALRLLREAARG